MFETLSDFVFVLLLLTYDISIYNKYLVCSDAVYIILLGANSYLPDQFRHPYILMYVYLVLHTEYTLSHPLCHPDAVITVYLANITPALAFDANELIKVICLP